MSQDESKDEVATRRLVQRLDRRSQFHSKIVRLAQQTNALRSAIQELEFLGLPTPSEQLDFYDEVKRVEMALIEMALVRTGGSQIQAANLLNIHPSTLSTKIKQYGILVKRSQRPR
jgi:DNA-binding protein Fis